MDKYVVLSLFSATSRVLTVHINQVPWALAYSKWYHQYPRFPIQALNAAVVLDEYTLTDRGTWLSLKPAVTESLHIYKAGTDAASDPLLNPAHVLLGAKVEPAYKNICERFMDWVTRADGGQKVIREFKHGGQVLYSQAPAPGGGNGDGNPCLPPSVGR